MQQEVDDASAPTSSAHWREYPTGFGGEAARMFMRTLTPFGVSLILTFGVILVLGFVNEERVLGEGLRAAGLSFEASDAITTGLDYLFRTAMIPLLIIGYAAGLGGCVALRARDTPASKALVTAADAGWRTTGA